MENCCAFNLKKCRLIFHRVVAKMLGMCTCYIAIRLKRCSSLYLIIYGDAASVFNLLIDKCINIEDLPNCIIIS